MGKIEYVHGYHVSIFRWVWISFVGALVQSKVVTMVVSHAALVRMTTHNSSEVDNLLLEWLCAKYCLERGIIRRILPVFFGRQSPLDVTHLGGNFFEAYVDGLTGEAGKATIMQRLSDQVIAHATVTKAVELLNAVGCWQTPTSTSSSGGGVSGKLVSPSSSQPFYFPLFFRIFYNLYLPSMFVSLR